MQNIDKLIKEAEAACTPVWEKMEQIEHICFARVLRSMQAEKVGTRHFAPTTGYGYDDIGRDTLERVYAAVFGTESAIVRPHILSGTHALAITLFGLLRPGDTLLSVVGAPYDTLEQVIGIKEAVDGSLASLGVAYAQVDLTDEGTVDIAAMKQALQAKTSVILVQRSRGYAWRPSLSLADIQQICNMAHALQPQAYIVVDNCYGEFTCIQEPSMVGADVIVGSLIKNPGGGLAPTGGYIAGSKEAMCRIETRLTAPGVGGHIGSYAAGYQPFYQGLFMAPHTVCQALKGAVLAAYVFEKAGYAVHPCYQAERSDIIQAIKLGKEEKLIAFCQAVQATSPIDSFAMPEPWAMPGYTNDVIMAAGTFVSGASIELSADAPIRPPYVAYWQGGLTYAHCRMAVEACYQAIQE